MLIAHTSVETRFLYEAKGVLLQAYRAFPEVPVVQRAALRLNWKGSNGRSPRGPSRPFFLFFFNPCFCRIFLLSVISCSLLPSLDSLSRTLHTTPTHQTLETCPPYAYLPSCTASVLTLHCHPSQILLLTREMSLLLLCSRLFSHSLLGS